MMLNGRYNRIGIVAILVVAGATHCAIAQLWSEEFDAGSVPNPEVWSHDLGDWGWGNAELQNYTSDPANARVENGHLVITALKSGNTISSARVKTEDKLTFLYGTVEARIQIPDLGNGLWPAFWTLGNNFSSVGWPECGELDVMEMGNASAIADGVVNRRVGSTAHWDNNGSHASYGDTRDYGTSIDGTFAIFKMEWTPTYVRTSINGYLIWVMNIEGIPEFHQPHFFILNLAVGGTYTGIGTPGDITAPFPAEYKIDYIRLYDNGHTILGGSSTIEPPALGTNLLENGGFESGTAPWVENLSGGAAAAVTDYARSGTQSLQIDSTGAGDWASPHLLQAFPAQPNEVYNLQGFLLNPGADPIGGSSFGLFKIEFRDESGTALEPENVVIGTAATAPYHGAESIPKLNASSPTDEWIFSEAQATAPAGTTEVGFFLLNVNQPGNPGPMYFDDVSAWLIAEPSVPVELNPVSTNGWFGLEFLTESGVRYEALHTSNLTNATWTSIGVVIGNGSTTSITHEASTPTGFYQVSGP